MHKFGVFDNYGPPTTSNEQERPLEEEWKNYKSGPLNFRKYKTSPQNLLLLNLFNPKLKQTVAQETPQAQLTQPVHSFYKTLNPNHHPTHTRSTIFITGQTNIKN